jgi:hypothetical protein
MPRPALPDPPGTAYFYDVYVLGTVKGKFSAIRDFFAWMGKTNDGVSKYPLTKLQGRDAEDTEGYRSKWSN